MFRKFSVCAMLLVQATAYGTVVPDDECPTHWGPVFDRPDCHRIYTCNRTDGAATITNQGTPNTVLGSTKTCDNCDPGCPDIAPPPMDCVGQLSVCFTESLSVSISSGITAGIPGLEATLGSSIGAEEGREVCGSTECGSESFPSCKKGSYSALMTSLNGITASMTHTYQWTVQNGPGSAADCNQLGPKAGGSATSTATGSKGSNAASCKWGGYTACN